MAMERKEQVSVVEDGDYARRQRVVEYSPDTGQVIIARLNRLLWLIAGIIAGLITFRFVLKLLAANALNGFVQFIYGLTDIFVAPFAGIISSPAFENGVIIDTASIFAIVVYALITWGITSLLRILFASAGGSRRVTTVERQR